MFEPAHCPSARRGAISRMVNRTGLLMGEVGRFSATKRLPNVPSALLESVSKRRWPPVAKRQLRLRPSLKPSEPQSRWSLVYTSRAERKQRLGG